ncbi:MAG: amidohydrolase family protein [Clostridia bacterium]|nr:amidohydrolase family protein [Clostridia bacterium]
MVIDFHTHTFPERIATAAIVKMQADCHSVAFTEGTEVALCSSMSKADIDFSVVLPVITNPLKTSSINAVSKEKNGNKGLFFFGGIHPDSPNISDELFRLAQAGIKGIKIHPVYQGVDIDDIRFLRILYAAAENGLIVVTHTGYDIGFPGVVRCSPKMLLNAIKQVGNLKLVAAHMGGWRNWQEAAELLSDTEIFIDTAFSFGKITPIDSNYYSEEELKLLGKQQFLELIRLFGSKRVLFGTDSPWDCQKTAKTEIAALPLSENERENIFSNNARMLLGI